MENIMEDEDEPSTQHQIGNATDVIDGTFHPVLQLNIICVGMTGTRYYCCHQ